MSEKEIENYIFNKNLQFMIFNMPYMYKLEELYEVEVLDDLKQLIKLYAEGGIILKSVKDEIFTFLSYARDVNDEKRVERINIINDIITILNSEIEDENLKFYRAELIKRKKSNKYVDMSNEEILDYVSYVNLCIGNDAAILNHLWIDVDDVEFLTEKLAMLKSDALYVDSINAILDEFPYIFKNKIFFNRILCVLNCLDDEIYYSNKKEIKKLVKQLNKI